MEYKIGDKIKITKVFPLHEKNRCFFKGDVGVIITEKDSDGDYQVDFSGFDNPKVIEDGQWWVGENSSCNSVKAEFELFKREETIYKKGEEILVSANGYGYSKEVFHSMEEDKVWCIAQESEGSLLRLWAFHKKIETKLPRFHEAEVGDLVYSRIYGYGQVKEVCGAAAYAIEIATEKAGEDSSTLEGFRHISDEEPTWFYADPKNKENKYLEERPNESYKIPFKKSIEQYQEMKEISNRGREWIEFSKLILNHIENYAIPQYGDKPDDQAEEWSSEDCFKAIERYLKRRNSNQREGQEGLDLFKMAHYVCLAYFKKIK